MKRIMAFALALCLLLCGCRGGVPDTTEPQSTPAQTAPTVATTAATEPVTQATTVPVTEPATEPSQASTVTVYLLETEVIYDSGYVQYAYDENYNLDCHRIFDIENNPLYTVVYENHNDAGMPCRTFSQWDDGTITDEHTLTWFADGKLKEEQHEPGFSGRQLDYDNKGDISQVREYYDGILETVTCYEYDGEVLSAVYAEDRNGNPVFRCKVENGRVVEKIFLDQEEEYSYSYRYDDNGNVVESTFTYEGDVRPASQYTYITVEANAEQAVYLLAQQMFLLSII